MPADDLEPAAPADDPEPAAPAAEEPPAAAEDAAAAAEDDGGACLIATAAHGTELAPQVQALREIRDRTVLSTAPGASFMASFNSVYYAFAPAVADLERENAAARDAARLILAPMLSTLSIMALAEDGSDAHVLALGAAVIALNAAMYVAAPAVVGTVAARRLAARLQGARAE